MKNEQSGDAQPMHVLFLCMHNSSRSQTTEGFLRAHGGDLYAAFSAGTSPRTVHPLAIRAMAEVAIDNSEVAGYRAKSLQEFVGQPVDLVITVCDQAAEECPSSPARGGRSIGASPTRALHRGQRRSGSRSFARCVTRSAHGLRCFWGRRRKK